MVYLELAIKTEKMSHLWDMRLILLTNITVVRNQIDWYDGWIWWATETKLCFGCVCVAGCTQNTAWRGVMRSLDYFFKAASNNRWCEGAWPPQLAGTRGGKSGFLTGSVYDPVKISCIVKFETQDMRAVRSVKTRTTYFVWELYLMPLIQTHSILINPP